jgi:hypothetical protein
VKRLQWKFVRRAFSILILLGAIAAVPLPAQAASERTIKARILEIDSRHDRVRADVRGRPTVYRVADSNVLRGFREGDLVLMRLRGATVFDVRLAVVNAEVVRSDDRTAVLRIGGRTQRFALAKKDLRRRLRRGDFVRLEVEERQDGTRVVTRVY